MSSKKAITNKEKMIIMPMISGIHRCSKCGLEMYWEYHLPNSLRDCNAYKYTHGSHRVILLNNFKSKQLKFRIECTKCDQVDFFNYDNCNFYNV